MKFCKTCGSRLIDDTLSGDLRFKCEQCNKFEESKPSDSLRSEINYDTAESGEKYEVMIENSRVDTAGKRVAIKCNQCAMPYLMHIYVGAAYISRYVCRCGLNVLSKDYVAKEVTEPVAISTATTATTPEANKP